MNIVNFCAVALPLIFLMRFFLSQGTRSQTSNAIYTLVASLALVANYVSEKEILIYAMIGCIFIGIIALTNRNDKRWSDDD